eukprot:gene3034-13059_t
MSSLNLDDGYTQLLATGIRLYRASPPRQAGLQEHSPASNSMMKSLFADGHLPRDFLSDNQAGRSTEVGSLIEVPRVVPLFSYGLLMLEIIVYGTYANVDSLQETLIPKLGTRRPKRGRLPPISPLFPGYPAPGRLGDPETQSGCASPPGELYRLATNLIANATPWALMITGWGLVTVAPELEAVMG